MSSMEARFAQVLQEYQLSKLHEDISPFDFVELFVSIAAQHTLQQGRQEAFDPPSCVFEALDLETKLWNLIYMLYGFRTEQKNQIPQELPQLSEYASDMLKLHQFYYNNPLIREIALIVKWLQDNSKSTSTDAAGGIKWLKTQHQLRFSENQSAAVRALDPDAPLREGVVILEEDSQVDLDNFKIIYKLILSHDIETAIEIANSTGNFALSMILVGAVHDYIDPVVDRQYLKTEAGILDEVTQPSGQKHKLLWRKTVYKLSQQPYINHYERLIYNYLCGGEIADNLKEARDDWEEQFLVYLNQLLVSSTMAYLNSISSSSSAAADIPQPQTASVEQILNILLATTQRESQHPLRVMMGGVIIKEVKTLLHNTIKKLTSLSPESVDDYVTRVVTHFAIFLYLAGGEDSVGDADITKAISHYIKFLSSKKLEEYIPIYLSFIPNEADARECYSLFLSSLIDEEERSKQIRIAKHFTDALAIAVASKQKEEHKSSRASLDMPDMEGVDEGKMTNVLRRTVERVMVETENNYRSGGGQLVVNEDEVADTDFKLYRSVEWFFESQMYEDAIAASNVVFRRFLLCGKLSAVIQFGKDKNFKQLIKDYDFEVNTKLLSSPNARSKITEEMKEELIQYDTLIQGLTLIEDWKKFLSDNKINGTSNENNFWKSQHIRSSIEKISTNLDKLIFNWFKSFVNSDSEDSRLFREFRSIYVPYLIIEILEIYQYLRFNDWKYMRLAFDLINSIANDEENDLLSCFISSGRLREFVVRCGEVSAIASQKGINGIFY